MVYGIGEAAWSILNRGLKFFFCCCCGHVGNAVGVVQAKRHVHSATGSGLSTGWTVSPQAVAFEVEPMGVVDEAIEDSVGIGGVAEHGRLLQSSIGSFLTSRSRIRGTPYLAIGLRS